MSQRRETRGLLDLLGAVSAIGPLSIDMYLPTFLQIAADLHTTPAIVPLTLSVFLVAAAVSQLCYGPIADRIGAAARRRLATGHCGAGQAGVQRPNARVMHYTRACSAR
jgi:MFS family permease